jgi:hypothetical protein
MSVMPGITNWNVWLWSDRPAYRCRKADEHAPAGTETQKALLLGRVSVRGPGCCKCLTPYA